MLALSIAGGSLIAVAVVGGVAAGLERAPLPAAEQVASPHADKIEAVIAAAQQYVGLPYRLGATGPDQFDCSGLVFRAFSDVGQLSRIGGSRLRAAGYQRWFAARERFFTDEDEAERGDLVMYGHGSHIGIYLGDGRTLSAVLSGVSVHRLHGLTVEVTGFLRVDWSGEGTGGRPASATSPDEPVEEPPEVPVGLVPPLAWLPPISDVVAVSALPPGSERADMRTASSRTFGQADGTFVTEVFARPIFHQPDGTDEWQPIDLRFAPDGRRSTGARVDSAPVTVALRPATSEEGFAELSVGDQSIRLLLPDGAAPRRSNATPEIDADGRYADYTDFLRGGIGLRVFARSDGLKAFLVLAERPRRTDFSFLVDAPGLALTAEADGSIGLRDDEGEPVARFQRPLALDSSDVDGSGGGVSANAATLALVEDGETTTLALSVDRRFLAEAVYPVYFDLTIADFGPAASAGGSTFVSSGHPEASFATYQRPNMAGYAELWHGRQPGTRGYSEAYLHFAALAEVLGGVEVEAAHLRLLPHWQHDEDARPTWIAPVADEWNPAGLTWDTRPASAAYLGRFDSRRGEWSDMDLSVYVTDVLGGAVTDHGLVLHANEIGWRGWKRILGSADGDAADLGPRLVVSWTGLRPRTVEPDGSDAWVRLLTWAHPAVAPPTTRFQVEVSADGFHSTVIESGVVKGRAGSATSWLVPAGELAPGEYSWRVRAKYGPRTPWSDWSEPATFVVHREPPLGDSAPPPAQPPPAPAAPNL